VCCANTQAHGDKDSFCYHVGASRTTSLMVSSCVKWLRAPSMFANVIYYFKLLLYHCCHPYHHSFLAYHVNGDLQCCFLLTLMLVDCCFKKTLVVTLQWLLLSPELPCVPFADLTWFLSFVLLLPPLVCCPMAVNFDTASMVALFPLVASLHIMSFSPLAALHHGIDNTDMSPVVAADLLFFLA